jgi:hypothetical protein
MLRSSRKRETCRCGASRTSIQLIAVANPFQAELGDVVESDEVVVSG